MPGALLMIPSRVKVNVNGVDNVEVKENPLHKKNPEVGTKKTVYGPVIYVEQEDALTLKGNEEVYNVILSLLPLH